MKVEPPYDLQPTLEAGLAELVWDPSTQDAAVGMLQ